jgi:cytochrome c oxidase subunit 3
MVMAVAQRAQAGERRELILFLTLTLSFAGVFLGVKYFEYSHKFHEGLLPGRFYSA